MSSPKSSEDLINAPFHLECSGEIFSDEELDLLNRFGAWMQALHTGQIQPTTDKQNRFIEVMKGVAEPESDFEHVFAKLLMRREVESEMTNRSNAQCTFWSYV